MIINENKNKKEDWNPARVLDIDEDNAVNSYTFDNLDYDVHKGYKFEWEINASQPTGDDDYSRIYLRPNNVRDVFWEVNPYWGTNNTTTNSGNPTHAKFPPSGPDYLYIHKVDKAVGYDPVPCTGEIIFENRETDYNYTYRGNVSRYDSDFNYIQLFGGIIREAYLGSDMTSMVFRADGNGTGYPQWYGKITLSVLER